MILKYYRQLPFFRGKLRLGKIFSKGLINRNCVVEFTAHHNIRYKIPNTFESLGVELFINGIYEKNVVNFLNRHIKTGDTYFDIGANIGAIGLPVVKNKSAVKYVGFEASPLVFEYLKYNFRKNNIQNYTLHNFLVHDTSNMSMNFYQSEHYGKSSLAPDDTQHCVTVTSICLDAFCKDQRIDRINWIKIDVQGFELYVFKGMKNLLVNKAVDNLLFEFEYWAEAAAGLEKGTAQRYLAGFGYELFDTAGNKLPAILTTGRAMIWAKPAP